MVNCPKCNSEKLYATDTCHTWPSNNTWMSCQNCFSAILYVCEDCEWTYTHGLNKNNPRSPTNESNKPEWLVDTHGEPTKHLEVPWLEDTDY